MRTILPLLFVILTTGFLPAQQPVSKDQQEIQQTVIRLFDALSARDAAAIRALCTTDARFNEYGEAWPVDTLIDLAITKNTEADFRRTNTLDFLSTTVKGDVAWTTYNLHSSVTSKGKKSDIYWMETVIAVREKKKWKVKVLHSTRTK